jgi:hypothetical protein
MGVSESKRLCRPLGGEEVREMTELALIVGGVAIITLCAVELHLAKEESEEPRWLNYVSGPYVRTKHTRLR